MFDFRQNIERDLHDLDRWMGQPTRPFGLGKTALIALLMTAAGTVLVILAFVFAEVTFLSVLCVLMATALFLATYRVIGRGLAEASGSDDSEP